MAVALCTFAPEGGAQTSLGTEDCFITARQEPGRTIYTVTAHYVDREGNRFFIDGETRGRAEVYVSNLANELSVRPLTSLRGPDGEMFIPDGLAVRGSLLNPYTDFSEDGLYCTQIEHDDQGGRLYGVIFTFEKPDTDVDDVSSDQILKYKDTDLGNLPGYVETQPDTNFVTYSATAYYRGQDTAEYPATLANLLGYLPIHLAEIVRGGIGNLGVVKSWNAEAGTLLWTSRNFTEEDLYLQNIGVTREAAGLIALTFDFIKGR